jgi:hypothetical protein
VIWAVSVTTVSWSLRNRTASTTNATGTPGTYRPREQ